MALSLQQLLLPLLIAYKLIIKHLLLNCFVLQDRNVLKMGLFSHPFSCIFTLENTWLPISCYIMFKLVLYYSETSRKITKPVLYCAPRQDKTEYCCDILQCNIFKSNSSFPRCGHICGNYAQDILQYQRIEFDYQPFFFYKAPCMLTSHN